MKWLGIKGEHQRGRNDGDYETVASSFTEYLTELERKKLQFETDSLMVHRRLPSKEGADMKTTVAVDKMHVVEVDEEKGAGEI